MNKTQYFLKMILLQAFIDEKWKKGKKIVLNQLNEIAIQWLHLTAVFLFQIVTRCFGCR